jgi:DNA-binding MarR family transcriptional regulator
MRATLAPHDLTHVQYVLLACLVWLNAHQPDEQISQADLAHFAATDVMMTSQVLRALETKRLIRRTEHPRDRRARALRPTSAGVALARRATRDVEDADAAFFAPLRDAAGFVGELSRLAAAVPPRGARARVASEQQ